MKASEVLQQYQKGQYNFQGKNLRGANFVGKDLSGADFSYCDIRGANFKKANLTGVKFSGAKAGLQKRWMIALLLMALLLIVLSGSLSTFVGHLVSFLGDTNSQTQRVGWVSLIFVITFALVSYYRNLRGGVIAAAVIIATTVALAVTITLVIASTVSSADSFTITVVGAATVALAVAVASIVISAITFTIAFAVAGIIAVFVVFVVAFILVEVIFKTAIFGGVLALFACFIGYRTLKDEFRDPWLRKIAVAFAAIGGTAFYRATLTDTDFTGAILNNTNFNQAILTRTCFKDTVKLNLARAGKTLLANPTIRDLLINPSGGSFINLFKADLRGANFNGANLQEANLKQADLSEASLQYANLKDANLTEVNAIKTNLSYAHLTGACLEAWNIDPNTKLESVECDYVFLLEKPDQKGNRERRPHDPDATFKAGDFVRLYQKALNTLQLFLRNGMNPQAFRQAFDKIIEENPEITYDSIQTIEKKDKDVLVSVEVPEDKDKGKLEQQFNEIYQARLEAAKAQAKLEAYQDVYRTDLKEIIQTLAPQPSTFQVNQSVEDNRTNINQSHSGKGDIIGGNQTENNTI